MVTEEQKAKNRVKALRWKRRHPDRVRCAWLRYSYGITKEQWDSLFNSQGRVCAVCACSDPVVGWHTDHDHTTGKVRSILCQPCNTGLGKFRDCPGLLRRAAEYLESHAGS